MSGHADWVAVGPGFNWMSPAMMSIAMEISDDCLVVHPSLPTARSTLLGMWPGWVMRPEWVHKYSEGLVGTLGENVTADP